jgi:hypothetical protein
MRGILRSLIFAAAGFAVASLYREWSAANASPHKHRHPLDSWENEGGALPEVATASPRPARTAGAPRAG